MDNTLKNHVISGVVTFFSTFLTTAGSFLLTVPSETWHSPEIYTTGLWLGLFTTIVRATIRAYLKNNIQGY